jgi:hypothetical protein
MSTNQQIRRHNFLLLLKEAGEGRGGPARLAAMSGVAPGLISQIIKQVPHKSGVLRGIGDLTARKLESGAGRTRGWMDMDHSEAATASEADVLDLFRRIDPANAGQVLDLMKQLAELADLKRKDQS